MSDSVRFEYIETRLFWGGGLTASELAETFGLSRQSAQRTIEAYRRRYPGQMVYDPRGKRHVAAEGFRPRTIRTEPIRFLDYLRGQALMSFYRDEPEWSDLTLTDVDRLLRPDLPEEPTRTVLTALLRRRVVRVIYRSKNPESVTDRCLSPNHLVFADDRYHLRAYCHTVNQFIDCVLSRIHWAKLTDDEDWVSSREDREWNRIVDLSFIPNPELPAEAREAILKHYETPVPGRRTVRCRFALAFYVERKLTAPSRKFDGKPLWVRVER